MTLSCSSGIYFIISDLDGTIMAGPYTNGNQARAMLAVLHENDNEGLECFASLAKRLGWTKSVAALELIFNQAIIPQHQLTSKEVSLQPASRNQPS